MKDKFVRIREAVRKSGEDSRFNILLVVIVILIVLLMGFASSAFSWGVKGWDSYGLLARANWIRNDPFLVWNNQWYGGFFPFRWYPFLPALQVSIISTISGASMPTSANVVTILTYLAIALGIYAIVYEITRSKVAGFLASFVCMASPITWSYLVQWGMLSRLYATPFGLVAIWMAVKLVKQKNAGKVSRWIYPTLVASITLSLLAHTLVTILTVPTVFLLLIFGIKGWGKKITTTLKIFLFFIGLSAFYMLPYLYSPLGAVGVGSSEQISFGTTAGPLISPWQLIGVDTGTPPWSTMPLSSVLVPSIIILIVILVLKRKRILWPETGAMAVRTETPPLLFSSIAAFAIVSLFALYYCLQGYLPTIVSFSGVYASHMSYFLTIFLSLLFGTLLGACKSLYRRSFWAISVILLIALTSVSVASASAVKEHTLIDIGKPSDARMPALENVVNVAGGSYRVAVSFPAAIYFNYEFNTPQMGGYGTSLKPDLESWQKSAVFDWGDDEETRFLLDWAAVKSVYLDTFVSTTAENKFREGSYVPCAYREDGSPIGYIYPDATPMVTGTDVPVVLVIGKSYDTLLHAFSYADYNSKLLIPVQGQSIRGYTQSELAQFDTIIFYDWYSPGDDITKINELLVNYVRGGGNLLISSSVHQELSHPLPEFYPMDEIVAKDFTGSWGFSATPGTVLSDVDFSRFSPPVWGGGAWAAEAASNVRAWASVWLQAQGAPVIVGGQLGEGNVLWIGMNYIYHIDYYHNNYEAHVLSKTISHFVGQDNAHWESLTEDRPASAHVEISVDNQVKGVLFKETYYPSWCAYAIDSTNKTLDLHVYPAGTNAMYVFLPENVMYPVKVVFELSDTTLYLAGFTLSLISLVGLLYTSLLGGKLRVRLTFRRPQLATLERIPPLTK